MLRMRIHVADNREIFLVWSEEASSWMRIHVADSREIFPVRNEEARSWMRVHVADNREIFLVWSKEARSWISHDNAGLFLSIPFKTITRGI